MGFTCNGCAANSQQIINALWLYGQGDSGFAQWVESGYILPYYYPNDCNGECYYWADRNDSLNYDPHAMGGVPGGDYRTNRFVQIYQLDSSDFRINNGSRSGKSQSNHVSVTQISIGEELAADSNNQYVYSPRADYTGNEWQGGIGGTWNWQRTDKNPKESMPPYALWSVTPSHSSTGGDLYTYCC